MRQSKRSNQRGKGQPAPRGNATRRVETRDASATPHRDEREAASATQHRDEAERAPASRRRHRTWRFGTRETPERELYLLAQHVAGMQIQELAVLLRPHGITPEQFHVLRVLDEAGPAGLACSSVAERSVSGDPDVTRLLDRLEKQGWVTRSREPADRRVVTTRITAEGRRVLERLDEPVAAVHARQFEGLGEEERRTMHQLLLRVARGA